MNLPAQPQPPLSPDIAVAPRPGPHPTSRTRAAGQSTPTAVVTPSSAGRRSWSATAASLPFPDGSFNLVVSTLSMHHRALPTAGLAEIGRVLRPGGRALIWDFRPDAWPTPVRATLRAHPGSGRPLALLWA
jgi:SAM-dependent methyltransferase